MVLRSNGKFKYELIGSFGKVMYTRTSLRPSNKESEIKLLELEGTKTVKPLDAFLGIDKLPHKMTCEMMCEVAKIATDAQSFSRAPERIMKEHHFTICEEQVERITAFVGACVLEEQRRLAEVAKELSTVPTNERLRRIKHNDILYLEVDGAMVFLRDKNGKYAWAECKNAMAFHSSRIRLYDNKLGDMDHELLDREYIGYIGSCEEFKYHFLALAKRNGCDFCSEVVILSDGASWIHKMVEEYFPKAMHILDLYHVKEKVGDFLTTVTGEEKPPLADEVCNLIEDGEIDKALALLEPYEDRKLPQGISNAYTYISNNRDRMNYLLYKKLGYFIGSGAIESGNKTFMQDRLKGHGMQWLTESAQRMLALRAKLLSGKWEEVLPIVHKKVYGEDYHRMCIMIPTII